MMHKNCLFVLCFLFGTIAAAQDFALIKRIDTTANFLTVDNFDNTYLLTPKDELLKYNLAGRLMWRYSNKTYGKPANVDATDPMRILLFYPGLQQIVVLNNNLNEIAHYRFNNLSRQITLVSSANTNGYWYFDQANFELHKIGNDFTDLQQSGNLYQVIGKPVQPDMLIAYDQFIYLHDPKLGILQFDRFGAYIKTILSDSLAYFQVKEGSIWYLKDNILISLNAQAYETNQVRLPADLQYVEQAVIGRKIIALRTGKSVYLYAWK